MAKCIIGEIQILVIKVVHMQKDKSQKVMGSNPGAEIELLVRPCTDILPWNKYYEHVRDVL